MKQLVHINREEIDIAAERYFHNINGFEPNWPDNIRMRDKLREHLRPRALTRSFSRDVVHDGELFIEGHAFPCRVLAGLEKKRVLSVYAFVLTTGELPNADQSIIEALYADFWATAYVSATGDALQRHLRQFHTVPAYVSGPVSPGFYDMDIKKISELFQILDGNEIGVSLHGFMMTPLKSCAGFYFVVDDEAQLIFMNERCLYCHKGNGGGCAFCCHR